MRDDRLVQARIPKSAHEWVKREAGRQGVSVASYLRKLILGLSVSENTMVPDAVRITRLERRVDKLERYIPDVPRVPR